MSFQPDNSRTSRARQAEKRAHSLMQGVLNREEQVHNSLASTDIDPWTMHFVVDESVSGGATITRHNEATRARRPVRRYDIQRGYRKELRGAEKRIDATLHLAESLGKSWDATTHASERLFDVEAHDVAVFERKRKRQNDAAETKCRRKERVYKFRRRAENITADAWDTSRDALGELPPLSSSLKDIAAKFRSRGSEGEPHEARWATARDLRKEPPLPEN